MKLFGKRKPVSMDEVDAEQAVSLPNKEVMSLLDVNANVDLGLDLAAPVDLAAAANLNVAAPIEASAAANVASPDAQAVSEAYQHGSISQGITGDGPRPHRSTRASRRTRATRSAPTRPGRPAARRAAPRSAGRTPC